MSFGKRLRAARNAKGYTQERLAKIIGVAKSTLTGYEKGNREPDVMKIHALAKALDITGDELLGIDTPSASLRLQISLHEQNLIVAYRNNPAMQVAIDRILGLEPEENEKSTRFRAARSDDNAEPQVMEVSRERLDKLKNASEVKDI